MCEPIRRNTQSNKSHANSTPVLAPADVAPEYTLGVIASSSAAAREIVRNTTVMAWLLLQTGRDDEDMLSTLRATKLPVIVGASSHSDPTSYITGTVMGESSCTANALRVFGSLVREAGASCLLADDMPSARFEMVSASSDLSAWPATHVTVRYSVLRHLSTALHTAVLRWRASIRCHGREVGPAANLSASARSRLPWLCATCATCFCSQQTLLPMSRAYTNVTQTMRDCASMCISSLSRGGNVPSSEAVRAFVAEIVEVGCGAGLLPVEEKDEAITDVLADVKHSLDLDLGVVGHVVDLAHEHKVAIPRLEFAYALLAA